MFLSFWRTGGGVIITASGSCRCSPFFCGAVSVCAGLVKWSILLKLAWKKQGMSFMSFYLDILTDDSWAVRCLQRLLVTDARAILQGKGAQSRRSWVTRLQAPPCLSDASISSLSCLPLFLSKESGFLIVLCQCSLAVQPRYAVTRNCSLRRRPSLEQPCLGRCERCQPAYLALGSLISRAWPV